MAKRKDPDPMNLELPDGTVVTALDQLPTHYQEYAADLAATQPTEDLSIADLLDS